MRPVTEMPLCGTWPYTPTEEGSQCDRATWLWPCPRTCTMSLAVTQDKVEYYLVNTSSSCSAITPHLQLTRFKKQKRLLPGRSSMADHLLRSSLCQMKGGTLCPPSLRQSPLVIPVLFRGSFFFRRLQKTSFLPFDISLAQLEDHATMLMASKGGGGTRFRGLKWEWNKINMTVCGEEVMLLKKKELTVLVQE